VKTFARTLIGVECLNSNRTERDPVVEAAISRGGMFMIGLLYIFFTLIISSVLSSGLQDFLASTGEAFDAWNYLLYALATFASLPLIAVVKHFFMPSEGNTPKTEITKQLGIFSISKKDGAKQLKHALLMWLIVFVPLDLISYLIPGMLEFQTRSLYIPPSGLYFTVPVFGLFLGLSMLVHFFVAAREELMYRGVLQFQGQEKVGKNSAMVISSVFFGLSHFSYWFNDTTQPIYFPIWWGVSGIFFGLMLAFYLRTTGRILPMILAHWWNNVVSTIAIRTYLSTTDAASTMSFLGWGLYLPLILCGIVLAIVWRRTLGKAARLVKKEVKSYLKQPRYELFLDIVFGLGLWIVLLLMSG
jgi:membrane protease YdiL (CAAX protease family)